MRILAAALLIPLLASALADSAVAQVSAPRAPDDPVHLAVCFSGGGTRAAAFGFGIALGLAELEPFEQTRLIDEVDLVAGVSGGSFIAAQLALDRSPEALAAFRKNVLEKNLEAELLKTALGQGARLLHADVNRSDAAADCYDAIFGHARLGKLPARPQLWIQATELTSGRPLAFTPARLRELGIDPETFPLGTAIAASAALPGILPPLNLQVPVATEDGDGDSSGTEQEDPPASTQGTSPSEAPETLVLGDGGIADNLALEAVLETEVPPGTRVVIVLVVNSRRELPLPPGLGSSALISGAYTLALQQRRIDELLLARARDHLSLLALKARSTGGSLKTHLLVIDFSLSAKSVELGEIWTRLSLQPEEVELLVDEGRALVKERMTPLLDAWTTQ